MDQTGFFEKGEEINDIPDHFFRRRAVLPVYGANEIADAGMAIDTLPYDARHFVQGENCLHICNHLFNRNDDGFTRDHACHDVFVLKVAIVWPYHR